MKTCRQVPMICSPSSSVRKVGLRIMDSEGYARRLPPMGCCPCLDRTWRLSTSLGGYSSRGELADQGDVMDRSIRVLVASLAMAGLLVVPACSSSTRDNAKKTVKSAATDVS